MITITEPMQQPDTFNRAIIATGDNFEVCLNSMGHYWTNVKGSALSPEVQASINKAIETDAERRANR